MTDLDSSTPCITCPRVARWVPSGLNFVYRIRPVKTDYPSIPLESRWTAIKESLSLLNLTLATVGEASGVSGIAAAKTKRYPAAQDAIARALGVSAQTLFPERYGVTWSPERQTEIEQGVPTLYAPKTTPDSKILVEALRQKWCSTPIDLGDIPDDLNERLGWIKAHLKARDFLISDLANALGIKRSTINNLNLVSYVQVEALISDCLGVRAQDLWPERYDESGAPKSGRKGRSPRATPHTPNSDYRLDLSEQLWLPVRDLAGLPGLPKDLAPLKAKISRDGGPIRTRLGVDETPFNHLPHLTRMHLAGAVAETDTPAPPIRRTRKRFQNAVLQLQDKHMDGYEYQLAVDLVGGAVRLNMQCISGETRTLLNAQGADLNASELRRLADILATAAHVLEIEP